MTLFLPARTHEKTVYCTDKMCGERLGVGGTSVVQGRRKPIWRIEPGWWFVRGILERSDSMLSSEARLRHETMEPTLDPRLGARLVRHVREVDLPITVRCPKCHRAQLVVATQVTR
jgi:hypothetical protein